MAFYKLAVATLFLLNASYGVAEISSSLVTKNAGLFSKKSDTLDVAISPTGSHIATVSRSPTGDEFLSITELRSGKVTKTIAFDYGWRFGNLLWANAERVVVQPAFSPKQTNQVFQTLALYAVNADGGKERFLLGPSSGAQIGSLAGRKDPSLGATIISRLPNDAKNVLVQVWESGSGWASIAKLNVYSGVLTSRDYGPEGRPLCRFALSVENKIEFCSTKDMERNLGEIFHKSQNGEWKKVYEADEWDEEQRIFHELLDGGFLGLIPYGGNKTNSLVDIKIERSERLTFSPAFSHPERDLASFSYDRAHDFGVIRVDSPYPQYAYLGKNEKLLMAHQGLTKAFPRSYVDFTSSTTDGKIVTVEVRNPQDPLQFFILNTESMELALLKNATEHLAGRTVVPEAFTIKSKDHVPLSGFITRTRGKAIGGVLMVHGGPHGPYDRYAHNADAQFLASIGFNVVQVNFRGSGGFGRRFERMGYGEWGRQMQEDLYDATLWAFENGIFTEGKTCIYGASYGAYAALTAAAFEPKLYQCAAGHVGVYDLQELYRSGDIPETRSGRFYLRQVLGEDQKVLFDNSPSNFADKIVVPVLLSAGLDDERAPPKQTQIMSEALTSFNKEYEVYFTEKEGHGFYDSQLEAERLERLGNFLLKSVISRE